MRNAEQVCVEDAEVDEDCRGIQLVVPDNTEIVVRRNYILDLMKTRSPLLRRPAHARRVRGGQERAASSSPRSSPTRGARRTSSGRSATSSARILCPDSPDELREDRHRRLPGHDDARLEDAGDDREVGLRRGPGAEPRRAQHARPQAPEDPPARTGPGSSASGQEHPQRRGRGHRLPDRPGPRLRRLRQLHAPGNKKFQPQFDVLSDGWRQPGSSIKPINYAIGIDDRTMTAATMFMDVIDELRRQLHPDPGRQPRARPGPPPLGAPVLAEHPVDQGRRSSTASTTSTSAPRTSGSSTGPSPAPVMSMGIGTLEVHPIDMIGALRRDRQRRPADAADDDPEGHRRDGKPVWPPADKQPKPSEVISPQAAYIITDILAGNTDPKINPFWGEWAVYDGGRRRPGRLQDRARRTTTATSTPTATSPRRRTRRRRPSRSGSGWATATTQPNTDTLSLDSSAPLWSRIMQRRQQGPADRQVQPPPAS